MLNKMLGIFQENLRKLCKKFEIWREDFRGLSPFPKRCTLSPSENSASFFKTNETARKLHLEHIGFLTRSLALPPPLKTVQLLVCMGCSLPLKLSERILVYRTSTDSAACNLQRPMSGKHTS